MKLHLSRRTSIRRLGFLLALVAAAACSGAATTGPASGSGAPSSATGVTLIRAALEGAGKHPTVAVEAPSPP
jgi:hypothetical protein